MYSSESDTELALEESGDLTWKPLRLLSFYRLILSSLLMVLFLGLPGDAAFGSTHQLLFALAGSFYICFSLLADITARMHFPIRHRQAVFCKQLLGLIFVKMHAGSILYRGYYCKLGKRSMIYPDCAYTITITH